MDELSEQNQAREFRQKWSHKPTPIPPNASGLWYSEECVDQLMIEFAQAIRKEFEQEGSR